MFRVLLKGTYSLIPFPEQLNKHNLFTELPIFTVLCKLKNCDYAMTNTSTPSIFREVHRLKLNSPHSLLQLPPFILNNKLITSKKYTSIKRFKTLFFYSMQTSEHTSQIPTPGKLIHTYTTTNHRYT